MLLPASHLTPDILRRPRNVRHVNPGIPVLRDQALLHENCIEFEAGYSMRDLLSDLHKRVFFWSGWPDRPVRAGRAAARHYCASDVLIRLPFLELAQDNTPYFSRCNSGATRMQHGKRVPRGTNTFVEALNSDFPASHVVEVTFVDPVKLPRGAEVARSLAGPWQSLFARANNAAIAQVRLTK
jgi:hypothetical protein